MPHLPRRLIACVAALLLVLSLGGCHYDYGYYSVGYSYGYDCSPKYHNDWGCDYGYSSGRYHAPCDSVRFRTGYGYRSGYGYNSGYRYSGRPCR